MKKVLSLILCVIIIFSVTASPLGSISASASYVPKNLSLYLREGISSGSITLDSTDELALKICDRIYETMLNFGTKVDIRDLGLAYNDTNRYIIRFCFYYLVENYPNLFWLNDISPAFQYSGYRVNDVLMLSSLNILYEYTTDEGEFVQDIDVEQAKVHVKEYNELIDEIINQVPQEFTDLQKALWVYDYLALNFQYDTSYAIHDSYTFLKKKKGVCDSYSKTFLQLMEKLGIPCARALFIKDESIDPANTESHSWNIIKLDGEYYHIDATWGDPVPNRVGLVNHSYFLLSSDKLNATDTKLNHSRYQTSENYNLGITNASCNNTKYDSGYAWSGSNAPITYYDGNFYVLKDESYDVSMGSGTVKEPKGVIYETADLKNTKTLLEIEDSDYWFIADSRSYYPGYHSSLYQIGPQLYYNDAKSIYYYDIVTGENVCVYTNPISICGFMYNKNGNFDYSRLDFNASYTAIVINPDTFALDDMGIGDINASQAQSLVKMRNYILNQDTSGLSLLKADVYKSDKIVDVRDLIRAKRIFAGIEFE